MDNITGILKCVKVSFKTWIYDLPFPFFVLLAKQLAGFEKVIFIYKSFIF